MVVALLVSGAVVLACVVGLVRQRRRIAALEAALADDAELVEVLTIQIRNHGELATSRSAFARPLRAVTPGLLRTIVHRETLRMMRTQLAENGVDADVRLRQLPVRPGRRDRSDRMPT